MIYRSIIRCFSVLLLIALVTTGLKAQDANKGKQLFLANCASCHKADMKGDLTGPALGGVQERWAKFPEALYSWIRNSQGVIADAASPANGYANKLYAEWSKAQMNAFPNFSNEDIDNILLFIQNKYESGCAEPPCTGENPLTAEVAGGAGEKKGNGGSTILWVFVIVLGIATILLARYINNLNRLAAQKTGDISVDEKSFFEIILNPTVVRILVFVLVILGGYTTVNTAVGYGRQQNYAPTQPIKFSHALHAGQHEIDCKYCHDGARRSKHSVIPSTNTCMNCHTAVQVGPEYGTAEILKIYASAGFNPIDKKNEYGPYFHDSVTVEERLDVYRDWLEDANKDNEAITDKDISAQIAGAVAHVAKPIEWIRIHNLPDHAYFNHAQHVTAGKVECQTCHGEVQEMEVVKQYSPLSMGWCVNCHRQTKIDFAENGYYKSDDYKMYEKYHQEIQKGKRNGVTVEEIGGLECQKCHY